MFGFFFGCFLGMVLKPISTHFGCRDNAIHTYNLIGFCGLVLIVMFGFIGAYIGRGDFLGYTKRGISMENQVGGFILACFLGSFFI